MKTKVLCDNEDYVVEIALAAHMLLVEQKTPMFDLTEGEKIILLALVKKQLREAGFKVDIPTEYFAQVPIIEPRTFIGLAEPFDVFAVALNYLSTYDDLSDPDDYLDMLEELKELYTESEGIKGVVYTAIFHTPVRGVKGYCAHITEDKLRVVFWGFDDLIENDISV